MLPGALVQRPECVIRGSQRTTIGLCLHRIDIGALSLRCLTSAAVKVRLPTSS